MKALNLKLLCCNGFTLSMYIIIVDEPSQDQVLNYNRFIVLDFTYTFYNSMTCKSLQPIIVCCYCIFHASSRSSLQHLGNIEVL